MKTIARKEFAVLLVSLVIVSFMQAQSFFSRVNGSIDLFPSDQSLSPFIVPLQKTTEITREVVASGIHNVMQNQGGSLVGGVLGHEIYRGAEFFFNPEFSTTYPITSRLFRMSAFATGVIFGSYNLPSNYTPLIKTAIVGGAGCLIMANLLNHYNHNKVNLENNKRKKNLKNEIKKMRRKMKNKNSERTLINAFILSGSKDSSPIKSELAKVLDAYKELLNRNPETCLVSKRS